MNLDHWGLFCQDVAHFYGRQDVGLERQRLWFERVQHVPGEALDWIKRKIFDDRENMPANLAMAVRGGWVEWKQANPGRIATEAVDCNAPGCENGVIYLIDETGHRAIAWCDRCAVVRRLCHPQDRNRTNLGVLVEDGWKLRPVGE